MSAGPFVYSKYELDNGEVARIRVQPETISASLGVGANTAPSGSISIPGTVRVSNGNRSFGIKPRMVGLRFSATGAGGYTEGSILRIPVLSSARYDAITVGDTGTYLGAAVEIVGKYPERVR